MASRAKPGVERETPISMRLRSFKRIKEVSPESTSGPSGHLAATNGSHRMLISVLGGLISDLSNLPRNLVIRDSLTT